MHALRLALALLATVSSVSSHIVITYPGWRGDNLANNGTYDIDDYKTDTFPYGMQWSYPCGGLRSTQNRSYWPVDGGAVAFQPGWFQGHSTALLYVNLGIELYNDTTQSYTAPQNYSNVMVPMFQINGPRNTAYPGVGICLPQVPLPVNFTAFDGLNATIQIVENAKHGAALFSCADITFTTNMSLVTPVTPENCQNDTGIVFNHLYAAQSLSVVNSGSLLSPATIGVFSTAALVAMTTLFL